MSFREKFKQKKGMLGKQHIKQTKNKDGKSNYPSIIRKDLLPAGVEVWRVKEGDHLVDILPFYAGVDFPIDPETGKVSVAEGDPAYVLDIAVHTNVGSMKLPFVCPYENFGLPCPICEFMKNNRLDKDEWNLVRTRRRVFYLIWNHDTKEEQNKGVMLWEISHHQMEKTLAIISSLPKGGGAIEFAHPDDGMSVAFTRKGSGATNTEYLGHRLVPRELTIPEKLLDMTFPIDSVVKMHPSYEEIETAFKGQRDQIATEGNAEDAGKTFDESHSTGDDVPAWMDSDTPEEKEEKKPKTTVKKKVFLRKK